MIRRVATKKSIACFFLALLTVESLFPNMAWALTSGPSQPESKQFAVAGTTDMVDVTTGAFKYNIPLMDVGGYPINLNYQSGVGIDDEASWVGLGWNLNIGSINRSLRGLPDDFSGDQVTYENDMKPKITTGGKLTARYELFGKDLGNLAVSLGIFSDSYTGIGAEFGFNVGLNLSSGGDGLLTGGPNLGLGINSNTSDGVSVSPSISLSMQRETTDKLVNSGGISASLGYSTREGLKDMTLGADFSTRYDSKEKMSVETAINKFAGSMAGELASVSSTMSYNTPPFYPKGGVEYKTVNRTYSLDVGYSGWANFLGAGLTGYQYERKIAHAESQNPAYGFMYAERGKQEPRALMDFMREKDNAAMPSLPNLPVPIATPDMFSYTSQTGAGQFRIYRNSSGAFFDASSQDDVDTKSFGGDVGIGNYGHVGVTVYDQDVKSKTGKWTEDNYYLSPGDFVDKTSIDQLDEEPAYFREVGEKSQNDFTYDNKVKGENVVTPLLQGKYLASFFKVGGARYPVINNLKSDGRRLKKNVISYFTAGEAASASISPKIENFPFNSELSCGTGAPSNASYIDRVDGSIRKKHHLSEIAVTAIDGKKMVYGLPVYNIKQEEYTFNVNPDSVAARNTNTNLVGFAATGNAIDYKYGLDEYYSKQVQPSYATTFLLTGIFSPDYQDLTGDGITNDDKGTAIKFNYSKVPGLYKWRTPYDKDKASYQRAQMANPSDDKASIIYGEKELWYVHSIETKSHVAYFITEDRDDALGVEDFKGGKNTAVRQRLLKEIRLYSKANLDKPIKTVVFRYSYKLCKNAPNTLNPGVGKLTLDTLYFKYESSQKGASFPYIFDYDFNPDYNYFSTDKWGNYKPNDNTAEGFPLLSNEFFPYTTRNRQNADQNAKAWQLSKISLPTGSDIDITYEAGDYAYVQDQRAMEMVKIVSLMDHQGNDIGNNLMDAYGMKLKVPEIANYDNTTNLNWFKRKYLNGQSNLYAKLFVNMADVTMQIPPEAFYDYVPGYAAVKKVYFEEVSPEERYAYVYFDEGQRNPFIRSAWQKMRLEYPMFAYPGYQNRIADNRPFQAAITAIVNAFGNLGELTRSFNKRAEKKKFCNLVNLNKSFARLAKFDGFRIGGNARVKKIVMSDNWDEMVGGSPALYGQSYEYTTLDDDHETLVSSGVASYEPNIGGDENPLRLPINYEQDIDWSLNNFFYLEQPMGESLFPAPSVCYSKVTMRSLGAGGIVDPANETGYIVNEFFTAKDFPTSVKYSVPTKYLHNPKSWGSFTGGKSVYELSMAQGYAIMLNDMHGKPKAERVFNQQGAEISSNVYHYNASEEGGKYRLKNEVKLVDNLGNINDGILGREIEMFSDMREQESINDGKGIFVGLDIIQGIWIPIPIPHSPIKNNESYKLFRSATTMKTIQYFGVVDSIVKTVNGSSITTRNLVFDQYTGDPVVTSVDNEFNDQVYSINIPAYWTYDKMGFASKTIGTVFDNLFVDESYQIDARYKPFLSGGDELVDLGTGRHYWVIEVKSGNAVYKRIIDGIGKRFKGSMKAKVIRSGFRNVLSAPLGSYVCLENPIQDNKLAVLNNEELASFHMIDAKATLYSEAWSQPAQCAPKICPDGYIQSDDGTGCIKLVETKGDSKFTITKAPVNEKYGEKAPMFKNPSTGNYENGTKNTFWGDGNPQNGRLNNIGVWLGSPVLDQWVGVETCVDIAQSGTYSIGFAGDDHFIISVDGNTIDSVTTGDNYFSWRVVQLYLSQGKHTVKMYGRSYYTFAALGFEIYHAGAMTLKTATPAYAASTIVFSVNEVLNDQSKVNTFKSTGTPSIPTSTNMEAKIYCANGNNPILCDGTPNCGFKPFGSCPDGYVKTADGQGCIKEVLEDTSISWNFSPGNTHPTYLQNGAKIDTGNGVFISQGITRWGNVLSDRGVWLSHLLGSENDSNLTITRIYSCIEFEDSTDGKYFMGLAADNYIKIFIDDILVVDKSTENTLNENYTHWWIYPIKNFGPGKHKLTIDVANSGTERAFAIEVYDSSPSDIINQGAAKPPTIYSSYNYYSTLPSDLVPEDIYLLNPVDSMVILSHLLCDSRTPGDGVCTGVFACENKPILQNINPYLQNDLGNWLPWKSYVYMTGRDGQDALNDSITGLNIRKSGYYEDFHPFWYVDGSFWKNHDGATGSKWVAANTITLYDNQSQPVESKDALGIFSGARYGYQDMLPIAVASNAQQREIFYDGFEDYYKGNSCISLQCMVDSFNIRKVLGNAVYLDGNNSHSGIYSLRMATPVNLRFLAHNNEHEQGIYLGNNPNLEYYRLPQGWKGLRDFAPVPERAYIISAWVYNGVKDPFYEDADLQITFPGNGGTMGQLSVDAVVEGWMLVSGTVIFKDTENLLQTLRLSSQSSYTLIDDIRIFPKDGNMKSYAYDAKNLRLMGEMDENNMATFYEYDDEGNLIRVKKETERGIMTLKENRSSYKRKQ